MRRLLASVFLILLSRGDSNPPLVAGSLTLWAWERPDDLRWLAGSGVGVALLERTVLIDGGRITVERRRQPLRVAADSRLTAVVRIETDSHVTDLSLVPRVGAEIADAWRMPRAEVHGFTGSGSQVHQFDQVHRFRVHEFRGSRVLGFAASRPSDSLAINLLRLRRSWPIAWVRASLEVRE
jgi:hypothetical protein